MRLLTGLLLTLLSSPLLADSTDYDRCAPDGVALGGYDVVTYFDPAGPRSGSAEYTASHGGLSYRFLNADNLARFEREPDAFLPTYRGWCAATLSMGRLACPDFTNYKIEDGELLLFEIAGFTNGREVWNSDPGGHRARANEHARRLFGQ